MLRLTICLLVARTAFAADPFPVDVRSYGPIGPDTNLVFNFEQIRRDQPPQIEMREENINKYRNRPRTTPPTPIDNGDMSPMKPEHPIPYTAAQWNALQTAPKYDGPVSNWKSVPAAPSFPHWDNMANNQQQQNNYNGYENRPVSQPIVVDHEPAQWQEPIQRQEPAQRHQPAQWQEPTQRQEPAQRHQPAQWQEPTQRQEPAQRHQPAQWQEPAQRQEPAQQYESGQWQPEIHNRAAMPNYAPTPAPVTYAPPVNHAHARAPATHLSPRRGPSARGQHKFDWNDVTTQPPTTPPAPVSAPAANSRMPPPPVPTLSPWFDGF